MGNDASILSLNNVSKSFASAQGGPDVAILKGVSERRVSGRLGGRLKQGPALAYTPSAFGRSRGRPWRQTPERSAST